MTKDDQKGTEPRTQLPESVLRRLAAHDREVARHQLHR